MNDYLAMIATANFPAGQLQPITGLAAFDNETTDIYVDGVLQHQPSAKSQGSP